jgi:putative protease
LKDSNGKERKKRQEQMSLRENKVEILAPAGSYDILMADFAAGADAVYLGGAMFGARAYANNLSQEELLRALDYAHLHDKKIYLTVNTLMKQQELEDRLLPYLEPFYKAGLSAVIVQDFGAFEAIKEAFPGLHIHASTQMTVTGAAGAKLLKEAGASRVVTARELNLAEIKAIHDNCDIEIESFIHGALCYCYSGQCLLSSFQGGRSGNRGRCAQPCRLMYTPQTSAMPRTKGKGLRGDENRQKDSNGSAYLLSPKDMCGLPVLPDIIEAGVYSLKIEGRMKNVNYAAGVTGIYRKYVDRYLEYGREGFKVEDSDINDLMDLYNRGAFTTGYYNNTKGREMISLKRPNHMGTKALKVLKNEGGRVLFEALEQIYPQDVFEIDKENSFSSGSAYAKGSRFTVNLPKKYRLEKGRVLYRMKNGELTRFVEKQYVGQTLKKKIDVHLTAACDRPLELTFTDTSTGAAVTQIGAEAQAAQKQPAKKERLAEIVTALGDTPFAAETVNVDLQGNLFVPVSALKELKRNCVQELENRILEQYYRELPENVPESSIENAQIQVLHQTNKRSVTVLVRTLQQAESVYPMTDITDIYFDFRLFIREKDSRMMAEAVGKCKAAQKNPVLALPHILRGKDSQKGRQLMENWLAAGADTFLVRSLEQLGLLKELSRSAVIRVITDANLYTWNTRAEQFLLKTTGTQKNLRIIRTTMPLELTAQELAQTKNAVLPRELIVYTHLPLMVSEQCVKKTLGKCDGANGRMTMTGYRQQYQVQSVCDLCYSILYDDTVLDISKLETLIDKAAPDSIRYEFIEETAEPDKVLTGRQNCEKTGRGHFELGVE